MKRRVLGLDRLAALVAGIILLALGVAMVMWWGGWLVSLWPQAPDQLDLQTASDGFDASWWWWASGLAGIVIGLLGLWWLLAHRTHHGTGPLRLAGTGREGRLVVDGDAAASTAAEVLEDVSGIRSAKGKIRRDRGELVADFTVVVEPTADLELVSREVDRTAEDLAQVLGRDDVRGRFELDVARTARTAARVS